MGREQVVVMVFWGYILLVLCVHGECTDLSFTHAGTGKVHILPILAVHAHSLLGRLVVLHHKFQLGHAVKQLGKMAGNLKKMMLLERMFHSILAIFIAV